MPKIFDVCAATGRYTDQNGQEKTRWMRVGAVIENQNGNTSIKLDCIPLHLADEGGLWLSCFAPRQEGQQMPPAQNQGGFRQPAQQPAQPPAQQPAPGAYGQPVQGDPDIPF